MGMNDIDELKTLIDTFNKERDWDQFHNGKDLAIALSIESGELLETFLWKTPEEADVAKVKEELADIFIFAIQLADKYNLDIKRIVTEKLMLNAVKYPVDRARGSSKKYTEF